MQSPEEIIALYRKKGLRITPQRQMIFSLLAEDHSHPTMEDIYQRLRTQMPDVSRSTVYKTLRELIEMGELLEVKDIGKKGIRYDVNTSVHHHLYCTQCHKLVDIEPDLGSIELPDEDQKGFKIQRSQVTFFGLCSDCLD